MWYEKELETFYTRTTRSGELWSKAEKSLPLGLGSHAQKWAPRPIFVEKAIGSRVYDVDGNDYVDFNMAFGSLLIGHCHPILVEALREQLTKGSLTTLPQETTALLAEELRRRFPMDLVRFANSGTEATMHTIRLARAFTGRDKIIKFEGCYHGHHDYVAMSVAPPFSISHSSRPIPISWGIPEAVRDLTLIAVFNDLRSVADLLEIHRGHVAAVIVEPVMEGAGFVLPEPGFLQGLRQVTEDHGALLILDEVKTGVKIAPGGACQRFGITPDLLAVSKAIGGGIPLSAFGGKGEIMELITNKRVFHAGTYNANPLAILAGLVTLTKILTDDVYDRLECLGTKLGQGYEQISRDIGLRATVSFLGCNGSVYFRTETPKNCREVWDQSGKAFDSYMVGLLNRGIIPQPGMVEQWTISVQHSAEDIERHLAAFREIAAALATSM